MFSPAKPLASLSSGLLARKGHARPAMRRQMPLTHAVDDLGWNDMGDPEAEIAEAIEAEPMQLPPVLVEREALVEEIEAPRPVSVATAARIGRESNALTKRSKAAFTLRLDADRHLRLRLASATRNTSAQQLVTQALDAFLESLPEVETLVRSLPVSKAGRLGD